MEALTGIVPARSTHRQVVSGDLELLAEHAATIIDDRGHRPGAPEWEVLRAALDAAVALRDLIDASDAVGIEGRDMLALSEHALSVLGSAVTVVEAKRPEAVAA